MEVGKRSNGRGHKPSKTPKSVWELEGVEKTLFRALAARANYLAQDRCDIACAVKEIARRMSRPIRDDWVALKRLGRTYFKI